VLAARQQHEIPRPLIWGFEACLLNVVLSIQKPAFDYHRGIDSPRIILTERPSVRRSCLPNHLLADSVTKRQPVSVSGTRLQTHISTVDELQSINYDRSPVGCLFLHTGLELVNLENVELISELKCQLMDPDIETYVRVHRKVYLATCLSINLPSRYWALPLSQTWITHSALTRIPKLTLVNFNNQTPCPQATNFRLFIDCTISPILVVLPLMPSLTHPPILLRWMMYGVRSGKKRASDGEGEAQGPISRSGSTTPGFWNSRSGRGSKCTDTSHRITCVSNESCQEAKVDVCVSFSHLKNVDWNRFAYIVPPSANQAMASQW